jgi:hypothetical protein
MGNGNSTSQKITQIIENYTEANAIANSTTACTQEITVDARGATILNCPGGFQIAQECSAMSDASLDTVVKALQNATLDTESTQAAEGIAMAVNVNVDDKDMVSKTLNKLKANCQSNAHGVFSQVNHYDLSGTVIDCGDNPDGFVLNITQYGDAEASCVVKQIVDSQQKNSASSKNLQKNIGLKLPDFGACIGVIALVILVPMFMPLLTPGGKKPGNLESQLKALT